MLHLHLPHRNPAGSLKVGNKHVSAREMKRETPAREPRTGVTIVI
jgi:hypothetical protein